MKKNILVTKSFDKSKAIGEMIIDGDKLPKGGNYVFAIGGKVLEKKGNKITKFELLEISLIPNFNYKKYLEKND